MKSTSDATSPIHCRVVSTWHYCFGQAGWSHSWSSPPSSRQWAAGRPGVLRPRRTKVARAAEDLRGSLVRFAGRRGDSVLHPVLCHGGVGGTLVVGTSPHFLEIGMDTERELARQTIARLATDQAGILI